MISKFMVLFSMPPSRSSRGKERFLQVLQGENSFLALHALEEIEGEPPDDEVCDLIQSASAAIGNPIVAFHAKTTLRILRARISGNPEFLRPEAGLELLRKAERLDDVAFSIPFWNHNEASQVAGDLCRKEAQEAQKFGSLTDSGSFEWSGLPAFILPSICRLMQRCGITAAVPTLRMLCSMQEPPVLIPALQALEKLDPENMPALTVPLLGHPSPEINLFAMRYLYRLNPREALMMFTTFLFSRNPAGRSLALHYAGHFPFREIEPFIIRFIAENSDENLLSMTGKILRENAHQELPFKLYWVSRTLRGAHLNAVRGIIMGIINALTSRKLVAISSSEFLERLKEKIKEEEARLQKEMVEEEMEIEKKIDKSLDSSEDDLLSLLSSMDGDVPGAPKPANRPDGDVLAGLSSQDGGGPKKKIEFDQYGSFPPERKLETLESLDIATFQKERKKLLEIMKTGSSREKAGVMRLWGRLGDNLDADLIKPYLQSSDPVLVGAAINALIKLDVEHLTVYLPSLMQNPDGKIRLLAARGFVRIDRDQIRCLIDGMLNSPDIRQRLIAVSASILVDFPLVKNSLLAALEKETNQKAVEKIGAVLTANPEREVLRSVFKIRKKAPHGLERPLEMLVRKLGDSLSVALDRTKTPEQLLADEESAYQAETNPDMVAKPSVTQFIPGTIFFEEPVSTADFFISNAPAPRRKRAKLNFYILAAAFCAWVIFLTFLIL